MSAPLGVPYVIGQWVAGERFYGRRQEIVEVMEPAGGTPRWSWIAGLRRCGKTSLLKQLDHLATTESRLLPLFWDLQGAGNPEELALTFAEAILDAEDVLSRRGIALAEVEDADLTVMMEKLARASKGSDLCLLCDEADELLALCRADSGAATRLWEALDALSPARLVLASSLRLVDLGPESIPGLAERFPAPRYLGGMTGEEARSLLLQSRLPEASRPRLDAAACEAILGACGGHPMLLQLAGKRYQELGDAGETLRQLAADRSVDHLLAVDCALLSEPERALLHSVALALPLAAGAFPATHDRLVRLGLLAVDEDSGRTLPNRFLADWLRRA